ncbi:MAG: hypothetical protein HDQ95_06245 [Roseburia sp.]|nr:hypothetical protein [Roseburia sp.]
MQKNMFKDLLFQLLNEYGEEKMQLTDIDVHDREDIMEIETSDGSKFVIVIKSLA